MNHPTMARYYKGNVLSENEAKVWMRNLDKKYRGMPDGSGATYLPNFEEGTGKRSWDVWANWSDEELKPKKKTKGGLW